MIEFERIDYFIILFVLSCFQKFQRTRKKLTIFSIVKYFEGEKITTHLQYNVYLFKSKQNLHALESFPLDYSCEQSYFLEGTPPSPTVPSEALYFEFCGYTFHSYTPINMPPSAPMLSHPFQYPHFPNIE